MHTVAREYKPRNMHATTDDAVNGVLGPTYTSRKPPPPPRRGIFVKRDLKEAKNAPILMLVLLVMCLPPIYISTIDSTYLQTFLMPPPSSSAIERIDQVSSIRQVVLKNPNADAAAATPNFYEMLERKNCLPSPACLRCLWGSNCGRCHTVCTCFCEALCKETVPPKRVVNH
jgi:hypothetical protein